MLRLEPQNAAALDNRGAAYLNLGDFDRAIRDFDESIRWDLSRVADGGPVAGRLNTVTRLDSRRAVVRGGYVGHSMTR